MDRRRFLNRAAAYSYFLSSPWVNWLKAGGPAESTRSPEPIPEPHFPDRLHLFVWRNWELANTDRLANVLRTTPAHVLEIGYAMGLPKKVELSEDQLRRIYITVTRQNWHILPEDQLIELLGWNRQRFEFTLKEDDFLSHKLGALKPRCERLRYESPSRKARQKAAEIKQLVRETFGVALDEPGELPFQFVHDLSDKVTPRVREPRPKPSHEEIDLTRGWVVVRPHEGSGVPLILLEEFRAYLQAAHDCDLRVVSGKTAALNVVELAIDRAVGETRGSYEWTVQPESIRVVGHDIEGLRQAIYDLRDRMEEAGGPYLSLGRVQRTTRLHPRYLYSYFALYGDPLMEESIDLFPDGYLDKLARAGVNGIWLQAVLHNLAPSETFREFGAGWETRLKNLKKLVNLAERYGVKVYLYLNEPRSMPAEFFVRHPEVKGTHDGHDPQFFALCTSTPEVRQWLSDSLAHVFSQVPGLGGVFSITVSENLTNCFSHGRAQHCPRCSNRQGSEVIAEVIQAIRDGVRRSSAGAEIIAWDWGWGPDWVRNGADPGGVIRRLPKDVALLSISEWNQPVNRGGFQTKVGEYSISVVGPGPRALKHWEQARQRGLATLAKVQFNNTWEISAVPYIPVPNLVAQHCENLLKVGIQGLMLSWTVGGYPSPNLEVAKGYYLSPSPEGGQALRRVAVRRYGREAATAVLEAWSAFSKAFEEFPYGVAVYTIPTQHGPANPLRLDPTRYKSGMMLFPYDDIKAWAGPYPVEVVQKQFERMATLWNNGLQLFRKALQLVPRDQQATARKDLGIAETCYLHFQSVANQIRFYQLRGQLESASAPDRPPLITGMVKIAEEEIKLAKRQYAIARRDSTIAYEASNHYYYRPLDLVEKVLNCHNIIESLKRLRSPKRHD